jgi:hypothetical protein
VRAAFDRWRTADPDAFPVTAEWRRADRWSSPDELAARGTLAEFDAEEARRRHEADEKRRELSEKVDEAENTGEEWRALLSDTGDDLVRAVQDAFELIGFNVIDSDALPENKGKKREDLRVEHDGWTALVEVKGYTGAAKSNDLQQLNGAAVAYAASTGSQADALWYVVNAYRDSDPAQRETPLGSRDVRGVQLWVADRHTRPFRSSPTGCYRSGDRRGRASALDGRWRSICRAAGRIAMTGCEPDVAA